MLKPYNYEHEQQMRGFYANLSEKDRRRYAALEARKLPYGGIGYLCRVLSCDPKTIGHGLAELDELEGPFRPRRLTVVSSLDGHKDYRFSNGSEFIVLNRASTIEVLSVDSDLEFFDYYGGTLRRNSGRTTNFRLPT